MSSGFDHRGSGTHSGAAKPATQASAVPGKSSLVQAQLARTTRDDSPAVQQRAEAGAATDGTGEGVQQAAAQGVAGAGGRLPHGDVIQRAFGRHDVSGIRMASCHKCSDRALHDRAPRGVLAAA